MSTLAIQSEATALVRPEPRSAIAIRTAVASDFKFIDALQKKHSKMVGFARTSEIEGHIKAERVLIAEDAGARPVGYCMYKDKYMHREDCGNIVQLNVEPHRHRGLIGAELIKTVFERVPYGVRLFCCWCAQDLEANHFWEAMGFVPLAFRTGSRGKAHGGKRKDTRMHIFWERRIREGDNGPGATPYWYPTETNHGALKEARIVLPIPPGTHWSDAKPTVLPGMENVNAAPLPAGEAPKQERPPRPKIKAPIGPGHRPSSIALGGLRFAPGKKPPPAAKGAEAKPKRERQKNDPKLVAAAREFRDRYLDEVNTGRHVLEAQGKYDVSRQLAAAERIAPGESLPRPNLLNAA